jgi:hypothetical protein
MKLTNNVFFTENQSICDGEPSFLIFKSFQHNFSLLFNQSPSLFCALVSYVHTY